MSGGGEWSVLRRWTTPFGKAHQERLIRNLWRQRVRQYNRRGWPLLHLSKSNPIYLCTYLLLSNPFPLCTHNYCDKEEGPCTESLRCICCSADWIFSR
ncbi:hypothetical protein CDAR_474491 [Caerostris darwini]|uniref:Uncharacterized protein n=1 Tax=Caerostris darwini TaxID=1538125 RepID=A0AAV4RG31_9ARAC|nr:hypothetical protein CDAR_474491 [Caerostris darwini]